MPAMHVMHIITDLDLGGAEMMLLRLLSRMNREEFHNEVVCLTEGGVIADRIRALGIEVTGLGMRRGMPNPLALWRLAVQLKKRRPDVVQSWMYHADLLGGLAAKLAGGYPLVWGIHNTALDSETCRCSTRMIARCCASLSRRLPQVILSCSETAREIHVRLGYAAERIRIIPNGFDLECFRPDPESRRSVRQELGLPSDAVLAGLVARFDPQKDHRNFIQAAGLLHQRHAEVHFLLCGTRVTPDNSTLSAWIAEAGIGAQCHLLGARDDVPRLTAALDVACSSSCGEAFPLVVGEAMACGVPCVVTDVGDSALLVGDSGKVVPARSPEQLAGALTFILELTPSQRQDLGQKARQRIVEYYNLSDIVSRYESLYREVVSLSAAPSSKRQTT